MSRQQEVQAVLRAMARGDNQPCLGCPSSAACADLELACRAFRGWVQGNMAVAKAGSREPSRRHFLQIMNQEEP